jgi:hypothetical protein
VLGEGAWTEEGWIGRRVEKPRNEELHKLRPSPSVI